MMDRLTMNEKLEPSIRDLNIRVSDVLRWLGSGLSEEQIMKDHPGLEREDFLMVFNHATFILDMKQAAERMVVIREEFKAKMDALDQRNEERQSTPQN
jgi:uncharacterized protein (DUF433 family)